MVGIALALALLAPAVDPSPLAPTGKWVVEYNEGDCTVSRSFGDPADPVTFGFRPSVDMLTGELVLLAPGSRGGAAGSGTGRIVLLPSRDGFPARWASASLKTGNQRGFRVDVDETFWAALPRAEGIELGTGGKQAIVLNLGPMTGALRAVRACGEDLLRHWGADPAALIVPPPRLMPALFHADDYPERARRARETGRVKTLSTVDPSGKPSRCSIVESSRSSSLDQTTCNVIMTRARFDHARQGDTKTRYVFAAVRWVLP